MTTDDLHRFLLLLALSALTAAVPCAGCNEPSPGQIVSQTGFSPLDATAKDDTTAGDIAADIAAQPPDTATPDAAVTGSDVAADSGGQLDAQAADTANPPEDTANPPDDTASPPDDAASPPDDASDAATSDAGDTATTDTGAPCESPPCVPCTVDSDCAGAPVDGGACQSEACIDGLCVVVSTPEAAACDDGNPCTDDGCDPESGCQSTPNQAPCDDGYACTTGDTCHEGACAGTLDPAAWAAAASTEPDPCAAVSCDIDTKVGAQLGCVFWTVDLPNYPDPSMSPTPEDEPHAVVVTNPFGWDATIAFTGPVDAVPSTQPMTIPAHGTKVIEMPVTNAKATTISSNAVRIRSDRPVTVQQFNPWLGSVLEEASLLLPEPILGTEYVVLSRPTVPLSNIPFTPKLPDQVGYFAVVAVQDDTLVTITVTAPTESEDLQLTMEQGDTASATLDAGQVLTVGAAPGSGLAPTNDLTGSVVEADKPVSVFGGHEEAAVADPTSSKESCCAENLEEQLFPTSLLGADYVAVKSDDRGKEADVWLIQAAEDGVTIDTNPPQAGASGALLTKRGAWIQVATTEPFTIHASGKIQVGQYLVAANATTTGLGDPALMLAVPTARFARLYAFTIPVVTPEGRIAVTRKPGQAITIDGALVTAALTPVGDGTWETGNLPLEPGPHEVSSAAPFGLTVYGYGPELAFGHAGGLTVP